MTEVGDQMSGRTNPGKWDHLTNVLAIHSHCVLQQVHSSYCARIHGIALRDDMEVLDISKEQARQQDSEYDPDLSNRMAPEAASWPIALMLGANDHRVVLPEQIRASWGDRTESLGGIQDALVVIRGLLNAYLLPNLKLQISRTFLAQKSCNH